MLTPYYVVRDQKWDLGNPDLPRIVPKGWGEELCIHNSPLYCGKILRFNAGGRFSLHYHLNKTETWYVLSGVFTLESIDMTKALFVTKIITPGAVIHIPRGEPHRLSTETGGDVMEVSTPHSDSDSYRIAAGDSQK